MAAITEQVRRRVPRWFARSGLLEPAETRAMLRWDHAGFSLDTAVRIAGPERAGLARLFRYCARPRNVRSAEHCRRWQLKERCLLLAGRCHSEGLDPMRLKGNGETGVAASGAPGRRGRFSGGTSAGQWISRDGRWRCGRLW